MQSLNSLGKVENVSVQQHDRSDGQIDEANAPAVALAFLAPWAIAIVAIVWIAKRIARAKR